MKQTNEIQICQQIDCKRFITRNSTNQQILRCNECYSIEKNKKLQIIRQQKQQLIKQKTLLQNQLELIYNQNEKIWQQEVQSSVNNVKLQLMKEKLFKLENTVRVCKRNLLALREQIQEVEFQTRQLNKSSQYLQANYYQIKEKKKQTDFQIYLKELEINKRRYILYAQLPLLLDNYQPYQYFSINDEIKETTYEDFLILSSTVLDKTSNISKLYKKQELCLVLKKGIDKWEQFFKDNMQYYENFINSFIGVYKIVYYLALILNIQLPYPLQLDSQNYPQFLDYKIFTKNKKTQMIEFKDSSLNQLQINIYYIKYQLNIDIKDKLYSFFDVIDLLNGIYYSQNFNEFQQLHHLLKDYIKQDYIFIEKNQEKHKSIPIKLVSVNCKKFQNYQMKEIQENDDEFDDVEILDI